MTIGELKLLYTLCEVGQEYCVDQIGEDALEGLQLRKEREHFSVYSGGELIGYGKYPEDIWNYIKEYGIDPSTWKMRYMTDNHDKELRLLFIFYHVIEMELLTRYRTAVAHLSLKLRILRYRAAKIAKEII